MPRRSPTLALALATLTATVGCGPEVRPLGELVAPEFKALVEDPAAPYWVVNVEAGPGATVLAPEDMDEVVFDAGTYASLAQGFPDYLELRVLWQASPTGPRVARVAMAVFQFDALPEAGGELPTEQERNQARLIELLRMLDTTPPLEARWIEPDEDGLTFVGEFQVPPERIVWHVDPQSNRQFAEFAVSLLLRSEDGLIVSRELVPIRAREEEKPKGPQ